MENCKPYPLVFGFDVKENTVILPVLATITVFLGERAGDGTRTHDILLGKQAFYH
jgi:hypothetical protein